MSKPFLTYDQQLDKLSNEKNLIIEDRDFAKKQLKKIGYFALIGGYKQPFKNPTTKKYKDGTRFEDILSLYQFDEELRELFLKYALKIERNMRSLMSYYFTEKYGENQSAYLDKRNYNQNYKFQYDLTKLLKLLSELAISNNDHPYINHQRDCYNNVPLWVLICALTLGNISKMYMLFDQSLKSKVCRNFKYVMSNDLQKYLIVMTKFRNVCAHSERLFSYRTNENIPDTVIHSKLGIPKTGSQYIYGKGDLFSLVITYRYLLDLKDFRNFFNSLKKIIYRASENLTIITKDELLQQMGFPYNWNSITKHKLK